MLITQGLKIFERYFGEQQGFDTGIISFSSPLPAWESNFTLLSNFEGHDAGRITE